MPNVMAALPNIGGALCSTRQRLADAHYWRTVQYRCQDAKPVEISCGAPNYRIDLSRKWAEVRSPNCGDMWRTYCCLTSFFRLSIRALVARCEDIARQSCAMVPRRRFLATFLCPAFSASRVQQVSDLHLKFALRPHHVRKYGRHPICGGWDQARKKRRRRTNHSMKIYMVCPIT